MYNPRSPDVCRLPSGVLWSREGGERAPRRKRQQSLSLASPAPRVDVGLNLPSWLWRLFVMDVSHHPDDSLDPEPTAGGLVISGHATALMQRDAHGR